MAINQEITFHIFSRAPTARCVRGQQAHTEGKAVLLVKMQIISR